MKFEEILPLLKKGNKAYCEGRMVGCYLSINSDNLLCWSCIAVKAVTHWFEGSNMCLRDDWGIYEEEAKDNKEKRLIDFSVSWHSTIDYMDRNEKDFIADGWETFKKESLEHGDGLMCHKLMMVKYE